MKTIRSRISRIMTWMLVVVLLCPVFFFGAAAEEATANSDFVILDNLFTAVKENPPADQPFEKPEDADDYCLQLYNLIDPDQEKVYYGGPEEATQLLGNINEALFRSGEITDTTLFMSDYYYLYVWCILHANISDAYKSRPTVNEIMKQEFGAESSDIFIAATDICFDYIHQYEPELAMDGYNMNSIESSIEGSDKYIQAYQEGARLFEEGKYTEAIEAYSKCIAEDEKETLAHFEIAEAYIAMRNYDEAKAWLNKVIPNITKDRDKARLLRRQGFIAIEEMNLEAASALYTYSLQFEESDLAKQELAYIQSLTPDMKEFTAVDAAQYVTTEYGIVFPE